MNETKVRILDAAERLIAERGFEVSLRTITADAGVNLAAVNYHFQSKEALIGALIERRIGPVNRQRIEMLDAVERRHRSGKLPLEAIIHAFVDPALLMSERDHVWILFGRLYSSPGDFLQRLFEPHLKPLAARFRAAFSRSLPGLPLNEITWRMHFTIGVMVHTMSWSRLITEMTDGAVDSSDTQALIARIVQYTAAGFRAAARQAASPQGARHA